MMNDDFKVYKNYFCINYDVFICKMSNLFQILKNIDNYGFDIKVDGVSHEFEFNLEDDGKYKALVVNHNIFFKNCIDYDLPKISICHFTFRFHHRKRLFEWDEYVDDEIDKSLLMSHVLFRCKNLIYPDLFLKHVDLMMVRMI